MRGSIAKRGKGSWRIRFDLGRDPKTGKRKVQSTTVLGRRADAERKMSEMLHGSATGLHVEASRITIAELLRKWLAAHRAVVSAKTHERQEEIVEKHLIPALGTYRAQQLTGLHLQTHYAEALRAGRRNGNGGLAPRTVLHHHRTVFTALKQAVRWRIIARNVAEDATPPRAPRKDMAALDEGQTAQVMIAADTSIWNVPIFVAATTGMRRGEVLALRWKDVDLERARVHITQVVEQTKKGGLTFKEPKTDRSRRAVTLPSVTVEALKRHRAGQAEIRLALGLPRDENALVFTDAEGAPLKPSSMTKSFERILGKAKPGTRVSLHGLRHSHASHLLKRDTNPKIVSERLGHASVAITLDLYSHILPGLQEDTAKVVDLAMRTALQQTKPKA